MERACILVWFYWGRGEGFGSFVCLWLCGHRQGLTGEIVSGDTGFGACHQEIVPSLLQLIAMTFVSPTCAHSSLT
jgi:hypothetical protein